MEGPRMTNAKGILSLENKNALVENVKELNNIVNRSEDMNASAHSLAHGCLVTIMVSYSKVSSHNISKNGFNRTSKVLDISFSGKRILEFNYTWNPSLQPIG